MLTNNCAFNSQLAIKPTLTSRACVHTGQGNIGLPLTPTIDLPPPAITFRVPHRFSILSHTIRAFFRSTLSRPDENSADGSSRSVEFGIVYRKSSVKLKLVFPIISAKCQSARKPQKNSRILLTGFPGIVAEDARQECVLPRFEAAPITTDQFLGRSGTVCGLDSHRRRRIKKSSMHS
jgi:hypothetical protein